MPLTFEQISEYIGSVRETFLKHRQVGFIPVDVYDYLEENGSIILDNEEKAEIRRKVELDVKNGRMYSDLGLKRKFINLIANKDHFETFVRNECKRKAVADFFLLEFNIDNF